MNEALNELKEAAMVASLRTCQLFAGLSPADLEQVARTTQVRSLDRGAYLFREGEPSRGFFIVQRGALHLHRVNAAGKEQTIHMFRAGESFAEATLAHDRGYPANARAVEPSQVLHVRREGFLALLKQHPELALRMLAAMSLHVRALVSQLEDLALKDVETRLANWLLRRRPQPAGAAPYTIELTMTKRLLAAEIGTVSETLSRTLAKFRSHGWLSVKGRKLAVRDPEGLAALLRRNLGE
jgi:CRP/FNR family transcriptional regulator